MAPEHLDARIWTGEARQSIIDKISSYIKQCDENGLVECLGSVSHTAKEILNYFVDTEKYTPEKFNKFVEWNNILNGTRKQSHHEFEFLKDYMKYE